MPKTQEAVQGAVTLTTPMKIDFEDDKVVLQMGNAKLKMRGLDVEQINVIKIFAADCYKSGYSDGCARILNVINSVDNNIEK